MTRCALAVASIVLATALTACGASEEPSAGSADGPVLPREASCELKGSHPATVTLVEDEEAFTATWQGQGVAATDTTGFFVSVFDEPGENGAQLGVNFLDGEPLGYFVSIDTDDPMVTNLDDQAQVEGDTITAVFPKSAGSLGDIDVAQWNAAFTLAGDDAGVCPGSPTFLQPFPD